MQSSLKPSTSSGSTFIDLWVLWRRKGLLLLCVMFAVGLGVAYLLVAPPIYESEARVLVRTEGLAAQRPAGRALEDKNFLATQAAILASPMVIRQALEVVPLAVPDVPELDPVVVVRQSLNVAPVTQGDVLSVRYRSDDPADTSDLINALIATYEEYHRAKEQDTQSETLQLIARREQEVRNELSQLREKYEAFRKASPLLGEAKDAFAVQIGRIRQLDEQLAKAKTDRSQLENRLQVFLAMHNLRLPHEAPSFAAVSTANELPRPRRSSEVLLEHASYVSTPSRRMLHQPEDIDQELSGTDPGPGDLTQIQEALWQAQKRLLDLSQVFGPKHPQRIAAEKEVDWWRRMYRDRTRSTAWEMSRQVEAMKSGEQDLQVTYAQEKDEVKKLDNFVLEENRYQSDIGRLEKVHDATLQQLHTTQLSKQAFDGGQTAVQVEVLQAPELATTKVWPKPAPFLGLCGGIGLIAGATLIVLTHRSRHVPAPVMVLPTPSGLVLPPATLNGDVQHVGEMVS